MLCEPHGSASLFSTLTEGPLPRTLLLAMGERESWCLLSLHWLQQPHDQTPLPGDRVDSPSCAQKAAGTVSPVAGEAGGQCFRVVLRVICGSSTHQGGCPPIWEWEPRSKEHFPDELLGTLSGTWRDPHRTGCSKSRRAAASRADAPGAGEPPRDPGRRRRASGGCRRSGLRKRLLCGVKPQLSKHHYHSP